MITQRKRSAMWRLIGLVVSGLLLTGTARADDREMLEKLLKRVDALEQQNKQLTEKLEKQAVKPVSATSAENAPEGTTDVQKSVDAYLKAKEAAKKAEEDAKKRDAEENGFAVGSDLRLNAYWDKNNGLNLATPNRDFQTHLGGWVQWDNVWFDQTPVSRRASQLGDFEDGTFFRRVRIQSEGTAWEIFEWNAIYALEGVTTGVVQLDEMWAGFTKIPVIGTVRMGHLKVPQGLEGDQISSSRAMTFLERAAYTDAFYQNFAPGVLLTNAFLDQHMTYMAMMYRQERGANSSIDFADGEYAWTGRVTALPLYENNGRQMLHLGLSSTWRDARKGNLGLGGPTGESVVRYRARPELRDAVGDFGQQQTIPQPGNIARLVDTGNIRADSTTVWGTEFLAIAGPFSVQSEWALAVTNDPVIAGRKRNDLGMFGGYLQLSYFLTGENRTYDRRLAKLATNNIDGPLSNFWLMRHGNFGCGAWEVAARYNYVDLNDGLIRGGIMEAWELGLNWYLCPNMKLQFEYTHNNRYDKLNGGDGNIPATVDGFGTRMQMMW